VKLPATYSQRCRMEKMRLPLNGCWVWITIYIYIHLRVVHSIFSEFCQFVLVSHPHREIFLSFQRWAVLTWLPNANGWLSMRPHWKVMGKLVIYTKKLISAQTLMKFVVDGVQRLNLSKSQVWIISSYPRDFSRCWYGPTMPNSHVFQLWHMLLFFWRGAKKLLCMQR
jgi:hypothetical protein